MKKIIAKLIFKLAGWKMKITVPIEDIKHSVMIAAPHTSNWDLLYAICAFWQMGVPLKFFIKDDHTKAFYGFITHYLGGIGVNREEKNNLTQHAASLLSKNKNLVIMVPAEGTRKRVEEWKKGFYIIAQKAKVPIALSYLDYKHKIAGVELMVTPSDNFESDMLIIENYYKDKNACYPELYNPIIFKRNQNG